MIPYSNQADLMTRGPKLQRERRHYDADGHERTQRRNGATQCPRCGLWWPNIEEPDMWDQDPTDQNRWNASGWWGGAFCDECGLLLIEQPDGTAEVYELRQKGGE